MMKIPVCVMRSIVLIKEWIFGDFKRSPLTRIVLLHRTMQQIVPGLFLSEVLRIQYTYLPSSYEELLPAMVGGNEF